MKRYIITILLFIINLSLFAQLPNINFDTLFIKANKIEEIQMIFQELENEKDFRTKAEIKNLYNLEGYPTIVALISHINQFVDTNTVSYVYNSKNQLIEKKIYIDKNLENNVFLGRIWKDAPANKLVFSYEKNKVNIEKKYQDSRITEIKEFIYNDFGKIIKENSVIDNKPNKMKTFIYSPFKKLSYSNIYNFSNGLTMSIDSLIYDNQGNKIEQFHFNAQDWNTIKAYKTNWKKIDNNKVEECWFNKNSNEIYIKNEYLFNQNAKNVTFLKGVEPISGYSFNEFETSILDKTGILWNVTEINQLKVVQGKNISSRIKFIYDNRSFLKEINLFFNDILKQKILIDYKFYP